MDLIAGLLSTVAASVGMATALAAARGLLQKRRSNKLDAAVEEAERKAFINFPGGPWDPEMELALDQGEFLHVATNVGKGQASPTSGQPLEIGRLFNLYDKQIERYQDETRARASWSFYIAMIAMFLDLPSSSGLVSSF